MAPVVADRARKARKASRLSCGCYINVGHLIARVHGHWVCIECLTAAREAGKAAIPPAMAAAGRREG